MLCSKCGKETSDEQNFCGYCGTKFTLLPGFLLKKQIELKRLSDENTKRKKLQEERWKQQEKESIEKIEKEREEKEIKKKEQEELERQENEKRDNIEKETVVELIQRLAPKDYFMLEGIRKDDLSIFLKLGSMEQMDIMEKLYRCGLIKKLDRESTFDEKERLLKFMDSVAYKEKENRIKKLMTSDVKERVRKYLDRLGISNVLDIFMITNKGKDLLVDKRKEMGQEWKQLQLLYEQKDKKKFKERVEKTGDSFPLFMILGIQNFTMMSMIMHKMDLQHEMQMQQLQQMHNEMQYGDPGGYYGGDYGGFESGGDFSSDGGFEGGGGDYGGFQPAF